MRSHGFSHGRRSVERSALSRVWVPCLPDPGGQGWEKGLAGLFGEPLPEAGVGVGGGPGVVADTFEGGEGDFLAPGFFDGVDHFDGFGNGDGGVGIAVPDPDGGVDEFGGFFGVASSADGDDGGEGVGVAGGEFPGPEAAHGEAGEVDAGVIDGELFPDVGEEFVEEGLLIVIGPPAFLGALGGDDDVGEVFSGFDDAGRAPFFDDGEGAVAFTASVEEEDEGPFFVFVVGGEVFGEVLEVGDGGGVVDLEGGFDLGAGLGGGGGDHGEGEGGEDGDFHGGD